MVLAIAIASLAVMFTGGSWHAYLIRKGKITPPPAAWVSFMLGMGISYWLYWQHPDATLLGNPAQFGATIEISFVALVLFYTLWQKGTLWQEIAAHKDQMTLGVSAVLTVIMWWIFVNFTEYEDLMVSRVSFFVSQGLMIGGYIGTFARFLKMKENHDSLLAWFCIFFSSLLAVYPAWAFGDGWSMLNAVRATVAGGMTLGFLTGLDAANGRFITEEVTA